MKLRTFSVAILLFMQIVPLAAQYSGTVFFDKNENNCIDTNDTAMAGIVVTDGRNCVKTASDGTFTLPGYEKTRFITITTPTGYKVEKHYIQVSNTTKSYDFLLHKNPHVQREEHTFIQITDTEIFNRGINNQWVEYLRDYIKSGKVAFLIHTGDICYESGLKEHIQVVNSKTMGCPVYYLIGNHDLVKGNYGEELFEELYGPTWFSFELGNIHYVITPMKQGDYRPSYSVEEVAAWLKNDLSLMNPQKKLVVFNHDILNTGNDFLYGGINLRNYNLKAWIYGHMHYNYVRNQNSVLTIGTATLDKGGIDHSASAYRVFLMNKKGIASQKLKYCFVDKQVVVATPQNNTSALMLSSNKIPFSVNAYYSGAEVVKVEVNLPEILGREYRRSFTLKPRSDWNWYGEIEIPNSHQSQSLTAIITAYFDDGTSVNTQTSFNYATYQFPAAIKIGEDWSTLLGSAHHYSTDPLPKKPVNHFQLRWTNNLGSPIFMSSPLIVNNYIYIATCDDNQATNAFVAAMDIQTGSVLWKCPLRNSVKNSIAFDNGLVFAQDASGFLYAIDARSGKIKWQQFLMEKEFPYLTEGLIATNGIVYAGTGFGLAAYHAEDGKLIWRNEAWKKNEGATTTLTLGNDVLVAGSQWGGLYGHDASTGKLLWKLTEEGLNNRGASAVFKGGQFFIVSGKNLFVIEPKTGKIITQKSYPDYSMDVNSSPVFTSHNIVFGTASTGLLAVDMGNFSPKWNYTTGTSLVFTAPYTTRPAATVESSPVVTNGIVWFGASDGCFYGLDQNTGRKRWQFKSGAPFFSSPAVSGNLIVSADFAGNVYAFCLE